MSGKEEGSPEEVRLVRTAPLAIYHPEEFYKSYIDQGSRTLAAIEGSPSFLRREQSRTDEELARRLQNRGYLADEREGEALAVAAEIEFVPHTIWRGSPDFARDRMVAAQMEQDEILARRIQKEEQEKARVTSHGRRELRISNGSSRPTSVSISRSNSNNSSSKLQWTTRGSIQNTEGKGTSNMPASYRNRPHQFGHSPLRDVMPQFRTLVPQDHPVFGYLLQIQRDHDLTPRSIVFPEEFLSIEGSDELPYQLLQILRGDQPADYESLLELGELLQPVSRGANKEQLEQLPTHVFYEWENSMGIHMLQSCGICLSEYERDDVLKNLTCQHSFHSTCADQWLSINRICPVCRNELQ